MWSCARGPSHWPGPAAACPLKVGLLPEGLCDETFPSSSVGSPWGLWQCGAGAGGQSQTREAPCMPGRFGQQKHQSGAPAERCQRPPSNPPESTGATRQIKCTALKLQPAGWGSCSGEALSGEALHADVVEWDSRRFRGPCDVSMLHQATRLPVLGPTVFLNVLSKQCVWSKPHSQRSIRMQNPLHS